MTVNDILIYAATGMNLENIILNQRNQTQRPNIVSFHLHKMSRDEKSQTQKVNSCVPWNGFGEWGVAAKGDAVSLLGWWKCTGIW